MKVFVSCGNFDLTSLGPMLLFNLFLNSEVTEVCSDGCFFSSVIFSINLILMTTASLRIGYTQFGKH
jgi:hypothetical protein